MEKQLNAIHETLKKILSELDKINLRDAVPCPNEIEDAILEVMKSHDKSWVAKSDIKHMLNYIPAEMIENAIEYLCENEKLTHDISASDWVRIPKRGTPL